MKSLFFLATLIGWQEDVKEIDTQIEELTSLKEKYQASMRRNTNNAMRWQFQKENYMDARRAWDQAAQEKQKIREIQDQINDLQKRKKSILQKHGQKNSS